jgi:hypothetical protein
VHTVGLELFSTSGIEVRESIRLRTWGSDLVPYLFSVVGKNLGDTKDVQTEYSQEMSSNRNLLEGEKYL